MTAPEPEYWYSPEELEQEKRKAWAEGFEAAKLQALGVRPAINPYKL
jgi:hypothetical protein